MLKTSSSSTTTTAAPVTMSLSSSSSAVSSSVLSSLPSSPTITISPSSSSHSAIAGYAAGLTGTVVGYPLDTLKLWMQTNRGYGENKHLAGSSSASSASSAASGGTRTISSSSGSSSSSNGSGSSFLRAGGTIRSSPGSAAAMSSPSAAVSTAAASHRMQSTIATTATASIVPTSQSSTTTFAQNALRMKSNLQALYSGVSAPLMTVGLVQSINFAVYDSTRRYLFSSGNNNSSSTSQNYRSSDPIRNVAIAGFVSGTATAVVTAPLILIKTHQQITGSSFQQALQSLSMMKGCMRAGFLPHLVCETFGRSVYYATYETMKRTFSSRMNNASSTSNTTTGQSHDAVSLGQRMVCAASSGIICW
eukprot:CAMPEP_0113486268 /NCGR_PEP_ID=MMETSP0014_2-20120614/24908_1 /TAXON_ID=2857 /ORGANISM="Nitzschia sp." /LENGTH=362 /DNA_ID=CAMNT_0000379933 /DNA_START=135 /DNA_END=1220 /DNA_ORIENTATION=- /assembly_acc=CAM_ASM_000159